MTPSFELVAGVAGKKLIETVVSDLYNLAKSEAKIQLRRWKAAGHIDTIYSRIRQLSFVKTIWQLEKEVDLRTFYFPTRIQVGDSRVVVQRLADLGVDSSVVLEGTVGQGKSIFLRHLATAE